VYILLVEDNPDHAELIEDVCGTAFRPEATVLLRETMADAMAALNTDNFDVALFDLSLPDSSIDDTVATLKSLKTNIPVVVLTSLNDTEFSMALINQGVQDYLPKEDLSQALLERVCRYAIERKRQQGALERRSAIQQMFCQSLSHDFKAPIRNIGQLIVLLRNSLDERDALTEQESHFLELMDQRLSGMDELVNGLYDFLRLDGVDSQMVEVDLDQLLDKIWQDSEQVRASNALCKRSPLPKVMGNASQLYVLLLNLIDNAIKYTQRQPEIELYAKSAGSYHEIFIKDNAVGIKPGDLERYIVL